MLVHIASNEREKQQVNHIHRLVLQAMKQREEALLLITEARAQFEPRMLRTWGSL